MKHTQFLATIVFMLLFSVSAFGQEKDYKYEREWFGTTGAAVVNAGAALMKQ